MKNLTVYLAGPMLGCSPSQTKDWRIKFETDMSRIVFSNPFYKYVNLKFIHPKPFADMTESEKETLVQDDKENIRKSDVVVANCWKQSVGTSMEIMYAYLIEVPVYALNNLESVWIDEHAQCFETTDYIISQIIEDQL